MVRQILKEFPDLGSFWYGHWEDVELTPLAFFILVGIVFGLLLALALAGVIGYVLQSVAVSKIAKRMGAWRNIRIMAWFPFVRHFAVGKVSERCDVLQNTEKRRLWGRILLIGGCILVPLAVILLTVALIGLFGTQLFVLIAEDGGSFLWDTNSELLNVLMLILFVLLIIIALPALLLALVAEETFYLILVVLPFVGIACLLLGTVVLAVIRVLCGTCYYKVLRTAFAQKTALVLTIIGAITGLTAIILFVASRKKALN
jgi:hypothetical protein